jgi:hypothetical protein
MCLALHMAYKQQTFAVFGLWPPVDRLNARSSADVGIIEVPET